MADIDPRQAVTLRLNALTLENYREARWRAINDAREQGMTWQEVGEAINMEKSQVRRTWVNDAPAS